MRVMYVHISDNINHTNVLKYLKTSWEPHFQFTSFSFTVLALLILPLSFNIPIPWLSITYRPWRLLTLLMALPLGAGAVMLYFLYESPKFLANSGENDKALEVLRKIFQVNGGKKEDYQVSN